MVKQTARTSKKKAMFEKLLLVDGPVTFMFVYKCKADYAVGTTMSALISNKNGKNLPIFQNCLITVIGDL